MGDNAGFEAGWRECRIQLPMGIDPHVLYDCLPGRNLLDTRKADTSNFYVYHWTATRMVRDEQIKRFDPQCKTAFDKIMALA
jgi:hypothetical protein